MAHFFKNKWEARMKKDLALFRVSGQPVTGSYPGNVQERLLSLGYQCAEDGIGIDNQYYPIRFYRKMERVGVLKKQDILSVFIFGYMPPETDLEFLKQYMKGLDRMIAAYTNYRSGSVRAGMTLCIEQEKLTDFVAEYCVKEHGVNAALGNIPMVYESSTGKIYVKPAESKMPLHYELHKKDLMTVFFGGIK